MKIIPLNQLPHKIEIIDFWIELADGTKLAARLWGPIDAVNQKYPVILEYLPYCLSLPQGTKKRDNHTHPYIAGHGFICVRVDIRGTGNSDGILQDEYLKQEQDDCIEVIQWLAKQPWCNGNVAMMGISWGGFNSLQVAARKPEALKMIISICATDDRLGDDIHQKGGIWLSENQGWGATAAAYMSRPGDPNIVGDKWQRQWRERLSVKPWWHTWMQHPLKDEYWRHGSVGENPSDIQIPVLLIAGMDDSYISAMMRMSQTLKNSKVILGPWAHKYPHFAVPGPEIGFLQEALRWFNQYLKGIDQGVEYDRFVRAYELESFSPQAEYQFKNGKWFCADEWPPKNCEEQRLYLNNGSLSEQIPAEKSIVPVCTPNDAGLNGGEFCVIWLGPEWPTDQQADDAKSFSCDTAILEQDCEIVGAPIFDFAFTVDKPQAHLFVRLCDVAPDGKSTRITYGCLNLNHNETHTYAFELEPDIQYEKSIQLNDVAYKIPKGHRLRISISTTYWPMFPVAPEAATVSLNLAKTKLRFPRVQKPLTPYNGFKDSEATPSDELRNLRPASHSRSRAYNNESKTIKIDITDDFGEIQHLGNHLIGAEIGNEIHEISQDGTNAVSYAIWKETVQRGGIRAETIFTSTFEATPLSYKIYSGISATVNGELCFQESWEDTIDRTLSVGKYHKNVQAFLNYIMVVCRNNKIKYKPIDADHVVMNYGGTETICTGFFDDQAIGGPILSFAVRLPFEVWFSVAVHEAQHMEQYLNNIPEMKNIHQHARIWKWLNFECELTDAEVNADIIANRNLEVDAERRSLKAIEYFKLPLDPEWYAKSANSYIYSYQFVQKHRFWPGGDLAPYKNPEIMRAMPKKLAEDYSNEHADFMKLFEKVYAKELEQHKKNLTTSACKTNVVRRSCKQQ